MNITKTALSYNQVTFLIIGIIMILGLTGYQQLSRDAMPPFTIRTCSIVTTFPGASPERVETLVTDKIEKVIQEIPELKTVTSESRTSLSIIQAELKPEIKKENLQAIWDKIRRKIEAIESELPDNILPPDIKDDGLGVVYGIQIGLEADGYSYAEMKEKADEIRDDLIRLKEAARVEIGGAQEEQIFIEYDNASLAQYGISSNQIKSSISNTNIVFPGGEVGLGKERIVIEPTGNYEVLEDLKKTLISIGQDEKVKLGDIANVRVGYKQPKESIVKINGNNGLVIAVALQEGANLTNLGIAIDEKIASYNASLPFGMKVTRVASQDIYVNKSVDNFVGNVIQSIVIVLFVMLMFLGLRTGLVVASLIPLAMVMSLMIMNLMDVGLNQVTLAALIMALGMLVDNAIVISESILVRMEKGIPAKEAAISSAKELTIPLLISTLTTSAAFLAFYLAQNTMGEMMGNIFIVITIALLSSWILALSIVAMLAVYFMKVKQKTEVTEKASIFDKLNVGYKKILVTTLNFPKTFILILVASFFGSLFLFPQLPFIFMPDSDRNLVVVNVDLPLGSKIEETEKVVDEISDFIKNKLLITADEEAAQSGVASWASFISKGPESYDLGYQPGQANSGYAHLLVNTSKFEANPEIIEAIDEFAFKRFPNAEISVAPLGGAGGAQYDVGIRITGKDSEELLHLAQQVKNQMALMNGTKNIKDDWGPKIKKVSIDIDQDKAGRADVTNQDIALSLQTALSGMNIGDFRDLDGNIPIMMTTLERENIDVHDLESINVFSQMTGKNVPLIQVANIHVDWQIAKIFRKDLNRTITVTCDAKEGFTASDLTKELIPYMQEAQANWKPGYTYEFGGESEASAEALGAVAAKLPIAGFIILLLLMLQFNSIKKTTIVLLSIPLGLIGVILGLLLFQSYFGFMAYLGLISLAGIVINNAIVLLDRIEIEQTEFARTPYQSIISAAQQRFRPILLTTFTTVLGLIPLYLGGGLMWEPMAVSIMIGLLFATVITLLFVPVMYKLMFSVKTDNG
ncbi:MAG: efflux RND transporter permease subunit [Bacteroidetes bacterium]|jgi:multidrug efflux pump subunit AcrB|nr:efflux RND transporter permease subunit [Bacteroidota bacterium]MDF1866636.1 efflux RND transporter permease subunit [Saprospiraceae bacterium]